MKFDCTYGAIIIVITRGEQCVTFSEWMRDLSLMVLKSVNWAIEAIIWIACNLTEE